MNFHERTIEVGGKPITLQTGLIARQANGSVVLKQGETIILATACAAEKPSEEINFFPLRVDYQEKFSSAGKTLGGFIKREGKPSEQEILTSRLIDRPIRPMFPEGYFNEVQLLTYVMSYDTVHTPDVLAVCAASAALVLSDIPLLKPIGAVRIGLIDDQFIVNPSAGDMKESQLDLILAGTEEAILMIEGFANFLTEEKMLEAVQKGHIEIQKFCKELSLWQKEVGKKKHIPSLKVPSQELMEDLEKFTLSLYESAVKITNKQEREKALRHIEEKVAEKFKPEEDDSYDAIDIAIGLKKISAQVMRKMILKENHRADGRNTTTIRPISIHQGLLHRTHGSSLFTRGETQTIAVCTLGGQTMGQRFETLDEEGSRKFYLQYSFPPFSVGEVGRAGFTSRREIGHGKLAERSLAATIPSSDEFPYTIRLESNITESNGSSSMASVCGGCLAMMEAGIPIKEPIAGIAMGLILEKDKYAILSDILGIEDALGDMDFKVAGSKNGITGFQMDIKVEGITLEIMQAALHQAKEGRLHILEKMLLACPSTKEQLSKYAPRIERISIKPSKIGEVIGPGGKQIRAIIEKSGAEIDIDESGIVTITCVSVEGMQIAKKMVEGIVAEVESGKTYHGKVNSVVSFGLFVEILPGKVGLCHVSEMSRTRVENPADFFKEGDELAVKVLEINDRGQIKLSHKATLE